MIRSLITLAFALPALLLAGCMDRDLPTGVVPPGPEFLVVSSPMPFAQVSGGYLHTCALRTDGAVECWGDNRGGTATPPAGTFTQVSAGAGHTCALRSNGAVECRGWNFFGQATPPEGTFTQVSAGRGHTCALRSNGVVECWGENLGGQVSGTPSTTSPYTATAIRTGPFTQVSAGNSHTCALRSNGVVECWGKDDFGQAPASKTGTYTTRIYPTATFSATPTSVVAGQSFTLALTNAQVPGWPGPVSFTYAFDCGDGSGYGPFRASSTATCPTSAAGTRTVKGKVMDHHDDFTEYTATVTVLAIAPPVLSANGTLDKKTGGATISGTVTCSAPTSIPLNVSLTQDQTKGKSTTRVTGSGSTTVSCDGTTPWSVTVTPASGRFAAGAASATASVAGATPPVQASQTVQLR